MLFQYFICEDTDLKTNTIHAVIVTSTSTLNIVIPRDCANLIVLVLRKSLILVNEIQEHR